jgi:hypothetical protein
MSEKFKKILFIAVVALVVMIIVNRVTALRTLVLGA